MRLMMRLITHIYHGIVHETDLITVGTHAIETKQVYAVLIILNS
jgi:hypothetical protein